MLHASRHDAILSWSDFHDMAAIFHSKAALPDQEEFVFSFMRVPGKFALHLDQLDFLAIEGGDNLWSPMFRKKAELSSRLIFTLINLSA